MNGGCRDAGIHARRPSGARARRPEDTHTFQGLRPPERKRARGARAATTARAGRSNPGRLVTETSPNRGGPRGRRRRAWGGLHGRTRARAASARRGLCVPEWAASSASAGLELQAAGRSPAGHRSRGCPGDSAASAASAPPPAPHWAACAPRDHRHLTFLKCVYYAGSDPGVRRGARCSGTGCDRWALATRVLAWGPGSQPRRVCSAPGR